MSLSGKKLAFVFPGQGSQFVGMASDYAKHDVVKRVFDEASVVLDTTFYLWLKKDLKKN